MTLRPELTGVPGVPESALAEVVVATLPANLAPAPWACVCAGLIWVGRGGRHASAALPPALRAGRALATIGGFISYDQAPVGQYDEVFGVVASRTGVHPWGHVAFMSVDSPTSLVGGRTNWAMPKTLATFSGTPKEGMSAQAEADAGDGAGWRVSATPRPFGPAIPWRSRAVARQEFPDGRVGASRLEMRARLRPALVTVEVSSSSRAPGALPSWLPSGRRLGAIIESATLTLGAPSFED